MTPTLASSIKTKLIVSNTISGVQEKLDNWLASHRSYIVLDIKMGSVPIQLNGGAQYSAIILYVNEYSNNVSQMLPFVI